MRHVNKGEVAVRHSGGEEEGNREGVVHCNVKMLGMRLIVVHKLGQYIIAIFVFLSPY